MGKVKIIAIVCIVIISIVFPTLCRYLYVKSANAVQSREVIIEEQKNKIKELNNEINRLNQLNEVEIDLPGKISSLISQINPTLDPVVVESITDAILKNSDEFDLSPLFILALIDVESWGITPLAVSSVNAIGLMQINISMHQKLLDEYKIKKNEAYHFYWNIKLGCRIYSDNFNKTKTISGALARYVGAVNSNPSKYIHKIFSKWDLYERTIIDKTNGDM